MKNILLVEDSKTVGTVIKRDIENKLGFSVFWVKTYKEAERFLNSAPEMYLAILDYTLPDAPNGEIIDLVIHTGIPPIVFTGNMDPDVRAHVWSKAVVDYVLKHSAGSMDYITELVSRIHRNSDIKILVVDDSAMMRNLICRLLSQHRYQTLEAENGKAALKVLQEEPGIKMVLTDYHMPHMNGIELTRSIRKDYSRHQLSVIGLSTSESEMLSARFIKNGANDFLKKPFISEELFCRITINIEMLEHVRTIYELSTRDHLTKLFNRNYFFSKANVLYDEAFKKDKPIAVAMLDIDFFKKINDTQGHDAGDTALVCVADELRKALDDKGVLARFGGEEFCVLLPGMERNEAGNLLEQVRRNIENLKIPHGKDPIRLTISIGICARHQDSLEKMLKLADMMLYKSKNTGRNMVTIY